MKPPSGRRRVAVRGCEFGWLRELAKRMIGIGERGGFVRGLLMVNGECEWCRAEMGNLGNGQKIVAESKMDGAKSLKIVSIMAGKLPKDPK